MKRIILVLIILIVIGFFYEKEHETVSEITPNTPSEASLPPQGNTDESSQRTADTPPQTATSTQGSDVGMEFPETLVAKNTQTFEITASNFAYSEKEIRVKEGDTVVIHFKNSDGFHDWVLDEFNAKTERIKAGGESSVTFVASKKGTFEYYCSVGTHRAMGMVGKLIVE